ncbi:hypothetical protein BDR22DRAFT_887266 [Usnea florida]
MFHDRSPGSLQVRLELIPPAPMYHPSGSQSPHIQYHSSKPAVESEDFNYYQLLPHSRCKTAKHHVLRITKTSTRGQRISSLTCQMAAHVSSSIECSSSHANADVIVQIFDRSLKGGLIKADMITNLSYNHGQRRLLREQIQKTSRS